MSRARRVSMPTKPEETPTTGVKCTVLIVTAYVRKNTLPASDLPDLIRSIHDRLLSLSAKSAVSPAKRQKPAVPPKRSVTPDYLICLEDGKKLKTLKRYLRTRYRLSPDEYRAKWGLKADYPIVAPNHAKKCSEAAKKIGLGLVLRPSKQRHRSA